jgi:acyl-CoA thioester hydrolase
MDKEPLIKRPQRITSQDLEPLPLTHQTSIPESYLDAMGHMNVMWYTHLFAKALVGVFELVGLNREYFVANQAGTFALKQFISYEVEVHAHELITIRSRLLGSSSKRMHLMHFMMKDNGQLLASTAEITAAHIDMRVRRTSPFPPNIAESLNQLVAQHAVLNWSAPVSGAMRA